MDTNAKPPTTRIDRRPAMTLPSTSVGQRRVGRENESPGSLVSSDGRTIKAALAKLWRKAKPAIRQGWIKAVPKAPAMLPIVEGGW